MLRNRAARPRGGVVELRLETTLADVAVGPGSGARQGARRPLPPWHVEGMELQLLGRRERIALTESPRDYPDADLVAEAHAVGWVGESLPGYSVSTRWQHDGGAGAPAHPPSGVRVEGTSLDNGLLRVEIDRDGAVTLRDFAAGRTIERAVALEDAADVGDLYTPAIREPRIVSEPPGVRVVHRGPLRGELSLEWRLAARGRREPASRCVVSLALDAAAPFVRVLVHGLNAAHDHRLRVLLRTELADASTVADAAFHLMDRRALALTADERAMEQYVPTAPLHRYVSRYDAAAGATIFSDGLAEYESFADGSVAVTLVRAVGALSRHDLPERPGHAGWPADTPLAQSIGPYRAELALAPHGPDSPSQRDVIERMADDVLLPLVGHTLRSNLGPPLVAGGLELEGDGLAFSAAMPAREPEWTVLRCVNRRDSAVRGRWVSRHPIAEAHFARLDETPLEPIPVSAGGLSFTAEPHAIVTVLVRWTDPG